MNEQIRQIADRIRGLREISRLSVDTCAQDLAIPVEKYREYESGAMDLPVSFFYQITSRSTRRYTIVSWS